MGLVQKNPYFEETVFFKENRPRSAFATSDGAIALICDCVKTELTTVKTHKKIKKKIAYNVLRQQRQISSGLCLPMGLLKIIFQPLYVRM